MTDTFRLCQHNIGPTSYYDTRGKDNKMLFIDSDKSFRNIKNYMRNCEYQVIYIQFKNYKMEIKEKVVTYQLME